MLPHERAITLVLWHQQWLVGDAPFLVTYLPKVTHLLHKTLSPRHTLMFYTVSQKTVQICFCQNFVKFTPILITFGRKIVKRLKLYKVHPFSTSPNLHHHTTVLNADVPKCYRTLKVDIHNKLSNDLVSTQQTNMWFI